MKKSVTAGLGSVAVVALLLSLKTCGKSGASDSPADASLAIKKERTASVPSSPPPPVERTSSGKFEERWTNPKTSVEQRVRRRLEMRAIPSVEMVSGEAVGVVAVEVAENGEVWRPETKAWEKMNLGGFKEWRGFRGSQVTDIRPPRPW